MERRGQGACQGMVALTLQVHGTREGVQIRREHEGEQFEGVAAHRGAVIKSASTRHPTTLLMPSITISMPARKKWIEGQPRRLQAKRRIPYLCCKVRSVYATSFSTYLGGVGG